MFDQETQTQGFCFWLYLCACVVVFPFVLFVVFVGGRRGGGCSFVLFVFLGLVLWLTTIFNFWCWKRVSIRAIVQKRGYCLALWPSWARGWLMRWGCRRFQSVVTIFCLDCYLSIWVLYATLVTHTHTKEFIGGQSAVYVRWAHFSFSGMNNRKLITFCHLRPQSVITYSTMWHWLTIRMFSYPLLLISCKSKEWTPSFRCFFFFLSPPAF